MAEQWEILHLRWGHKDWTGFRGARLLIHIWQSPGAQRRGEFCGNKELQAFFQRTKDQLMEGIILEQPVRDIQVSSSQK